MVITKFLKEWLKTHDWPEEPIRVGPGTCGGKCRKDHAYAEAVGKPNMIEGETVWAFVYDRPCNYHESAYDRKQRKKVGLGGVRGQA